MISTHLSTLLLSMMPEGSPSGTLLRPDQMNFILSAVWKTLSMLKSHMGESKGKMWRSPSQFKTRWRLKKETRGEHSKLKIPKGHNLWLKNLFYFPKQISY